MFVKLYRADKCVEFFETPNYLVSPEKDVNPLIVRIEIFNGKKKVYKWERPHIAEYIRNYKPATTEQVLKPAETPVPEPAKES